MLFCIHGGGYTRRYWHAAFAGYPGYSFAEHLTAHGRSRRRNSAARKWRRRITMRCAV
jgi:hypothetical protein